MDKASNNNSEPAQGLHTFKSGPETSICVCYSLVIHVTLSEHVTVGTRTF